MALFNLKTGRPVEMPEAQVVSDLDAMVAHPVAFRLHGKVHYIKPISVKEFYAFTNALAGISALESEQKLTSAQVIDLYERLIASVCDSISRREIEMMTQAQCAALLQLIVECVTGKAQTEPGEASGEKKNSLGIPALAFQPPNRWQRLAYYLGGRLNRF